MSQRDTGGAEDTLSVSCLLEDIDFDEGKHRSDINEAAQFSDKSNPVDGVRFFYQNELSLLDFLGKDASRNWNKEEDTSWSLKIEGNTTEETKLSYLSKGAAHLDASNKDIYVLRFFCGLNDNQEDPVRYMMMNLVAQLLRGLQRTGRKVLRVNKSKKLCQDMNLDELIAFFYELVEQCGRWIYIILDHVTYYHKDHKTRMQSTLCMLNCLVRSEHKYVHMKLIMTSPTQLDGFTTNDPEIGWCVDGCTWPCEKKEAYWGGNSSDILRARITPIPSITPR